MKKILLLCVVCITSGCSSMPLVGSLAGNGVTAVATQQVEKSLISATIDVAVHDKTGKTPSQHLMSAMKKTKKEYEKAVYLYEDFRSDTRETYFAFKDYYTSP